MTVLLRLVLVVISLGILYGRTLLAHMGWAADPFTFNNDVRQQIYPFFKFVDPNLFPHDLAAAYYLDNFPLGYKALYMTFSGGIDPSTLSKILPYILYLVMLVLAGMASYRLGGIFSAWLTLVICLSSPIFLRAMAGGLPRAFAFPLLACGILALVTGRVSMLALCTVVAAAFYAPAAALLGLSLAIIVILPAQDRGQAADWSLRKRLAVVATTALLTVVILLPVMISSAEYGPSLRASDVTAYPEIGTDGRYGADVYPPFTPLPLAFLRIIRTMIDGQQLQWLRNIYALMSMSSWRVPVALGVLGGTVLLGAGFVYALRLSNQVRRVCVLVIIAVGVYLIAQPVAPALYVPRRYIAYPVPLLIAVLLPASVHAMFALGGRFTQNTLMKNTAFPKALLLLMSGLCYVTLGGADSPKVGLTTYATGHTKMYSFIATLPKEERLAAWPLGLADNIPYLSRREVLITYETHQVFHKGYADEMRRRMRAVIDTYYATDEASLLVLRDTFGVRYLIVDTNHFGTADPPYFQPFDDWVHETRQRAPSDFQQLAVFRLQDQLGIFRDGSLIILDLCQLSQP